MPQPPPPDPYELLRTFHAVPADFCALSAVDASAVPRPFAQLLVHDQHMTVTLEAYHDSLVDVEVLGVRRTDRHYARHSVLRLQRGGRPVQYGLVRFDRSLMPAKARALIEAEELPLGRILITENVLRQVELASTWRVQAGAELRRLLQLAPQPLCTFGRTAWIHVQDAPAVELLEIVVPPPETGMAAAADARGQR